MKKIKKSIQVICLCGLTIAILLSTGCSAKKDVLIDVDALANRLITEITYLDEMDDEFDADQVAMVYGIDGTDFVKSHIYLSTGATAEEIAVFEAKDKTSAEAIFAAMQTRIEEQKIGFVDYAPEEMIKLKDPVIRQQGNYVVLCVSNESDQAIKVIGEYFK